MSIKRQDISSSKAVHNIQVQVEQIHGQAHKFSITIDKQKSVYSFLMDFLLYLYMSATMRSWHCVDGKFA